MKSIQSLPAFLIPLVTLACALPLGCTSSGNSSGDGDGDGDTPAAGGEHAGGGSGGNATGGGGGSSGGSSAGGSGTGGNEPGAGGSSTDPCAGLTLCDDFEAETINAALWSVETSGENTMQLTTEHAAHGNKSIHIHAQNGYARLRNESAFPMPNNDYYGRMYLRVARYSTVAWAHWTVGEGAGTGNGSLIRIGGQYDTNIQANRWGVGSDGGPTGDWTRRDNDPPGSAMEPPENTWTCVEWLHKGSTNETRFYIEGQEHPSLYTTADDHDGSGEYILPQMTSFWFGWWQYQSDPEPFDVWIDLVSIDDERIGCLP